MSNEAELTPAEISAVIEMALSDHIAFAEIEAQFGLSDKQVKVLMRDNLKPSSYRTWRKRVRTFGDRREHYK
ncbi:MAG: TIGR03643 family protein [Pseudomonadota bacterium]